MIHWLGEPLRGRHPILLSKLRRIRSTQPAGATLLSETASSLFLYPGAITKESSVLSTRLVLLYFLLCNKRATPAEFSHKVTFVLYWFSTG
jgi:hypothetical protein